MSHQQPKTAKRAAQVYIPALAGMWKTVGWCVAIAVVFLIIGLLPSLEQTPLAYIALLLASTLAGFAASLAMTAWVLTAVKQMIHEFARGWRKTPRFQETD